MPAVQPSVYREFRRIVAEATGINLGPHKDALVAARIGKRMRALGIESHKAYLERVVTDESGEEMTHLIDSICTNVTSFFREEEHFAFAREYVTELARTGQTRFRLWSAACSTGEEPYSLAMSLHDLTQTYPSMDLRILGTDLSTRALRIAQAAEYPVARVAGLHPEVRKRYFTKRGKGDDVRYHVKPWVTRLALFRQMNLARTPYPIKGPLDLVLCRNVMIYFEKDVRETLLAEVQRVLRPGGFLLVGHAESLSGTGSGFELVRPSVYRKR